MCILSHFEAIQTIHCRKKKKRNLLKHHNLKQWFSNFTVYQNHQESSGKHELLGLPPRDPDTMGLEEALIIFIFSEFPGL